MEKLTGLKKIKTAVFISGTGSNLKNLIKFSKLKKSPISINLILSNDSKSKGLQYGKIFKIKKKIFNFKKKHIDEKKILFELKENKIDLICLAGFMKILSKTFINNFNGKILNIHPSLLPSFKGLDTHKRALDAGVKFAGCTVHLVRAGVDEGPIISQAATSIRSIDNAESLGRKILKLEHKLYPICLQLFAEKLITVSNDKVSYKAEAIKKLEEFKV